MNSIFLHSVESLHRLPKFLLCGGVWLLTFFVIAGCQPASSSGNTSAGKAPETTTADPKSAPKKNEPAKPAATGKADPYLEGWKKPAAALILSGEIHGYLEPCGCSLTQSGGFARRAHLFRELREKGWPVAGLDVGGTLKKANRQDQIKFESILTAMQELKYAAMALGTEELLLGPDFLLTQHLVDDPTAVSFLDANVVLFDSPDLGTPIPSKVIQVGDVKIGIAGVLGPSHRSTIAPEGVNTNITVDDPLTVLPGVIQKLQAEQPDVLCCCRMARLRKRKNWRRRFPSSASSSPPAVLMKPPASPSL